MAYTILNLHDFPVDATSGVPTSALPVVPTEQQVPAESSTSKSQIGRKISSSAYTVLPDVASDVSSVTPSSDVPTITALLSTSTVVADSPFVTRVTSGALPEATTVSSEATLSESDVLTSSFTPVTPVAETSATSVLSTAESIASVDSSEFLTDREASPMH